MMAKEIFDAIEGGVEVMRHNQLKIRRTLLTHLAIVAVRNASDAMSRATAGLRLTMPILFSSKASGANEVLTA
jgi:hypothetical protein